MKRLISHAILLCIFAATVVLAQAQQRPSDNEIDAMFQALVAQRNANADQVVQLSAKLVVMEKALKEAQAKECKPEAKKEK